MNLPSKNHQPSFVDRISPDPAWDYYEVWNQCLEAKCQIDEVLDLIKAKEQADKDCIFKVSQHIKDAILALSTIDLNGIDKLAGF